MNRKIILDNISTIDNISNSDDNKNLDNISNLDNNKNLDNIDNLDNNKNLDKLHKLKNEKHIIKYNEIEKAVLKKNIQMEDIFILNLPENENIWFFEYLTIRDNCKPNTEEYYKIKNMIYDKYINLKNENIITRIINCNHNDVVIFFKFCINNIKDIMTIYQKIVHFMDYNNDDVITSFKFCINNIKDVMIIYQKIAHLKNCLNCLKYLINYLINYLMNYFI